MQWWPHGDLVKIKLLQDFQSEATVTYFKDSEHLVGAVTAGALLLAGVAVKVTDR